MTPPISADLGSHDLGSIILFEKLGMGQEMGVVFASIIRSINLALSLAGIFFLIKAGVGIFKHKAIEVIDKIINLGKLDIKTR